MITEKQRERAKIFSNMHKERKMFVLPNAWDAGSAVVFERAGFAAVATSSAGIAYALGCPDGETITFDELLYVVERMAQRIGIPLSVDAERGYAETPEGVRRVDAEEICYMEAFAHSCELHTLSECITVKSGISALEKEAVRLGVPLFRCHRSYAVNIAQVRAIEREAALLSDGSRIPVSRRLYQELNRQFIDYFLKRER